MSNGKDRNYVSVWFWFWAMLVLAIPCINIVMILVWAVVGENESRKNYFRAMILWFLLWTVIGLILFAVGLWPELQKHFQEWQRMRT